MIPDDLLGNSSIKNDIQGHTNNIDHKIETKSNDLHLIKQINEIS